MEKGEAIKYFGKLSIHTEKKKRLWIPSLAQKFQMNQTAKCHKALKFTETMLSVIVIHSIFQNVPLNEV